MAPGAMNNLNALEEQDKRYCLASCDAQADCCGVVAIPAGSTGWMCWLKTKASGCEGTEAFTGAQSYMKLKYKTAIEEKAAAAKAAKEKADAEAKAAEEAAAAAKKAVDDK